MTKSIPTMHDLLEANGRMNNFRRLVGKSTPHKAVRCFRTPMFTSGPRRWDSCCNRAIVLNFAQALSKMIDEVVAVQEPSGYLNTYYQDDRKSLRMLPQTQTDGPRAL